MSEEILTKLLGVEDYLEEFNINKKFAKVCLINILINFLKFFIKKVISKKK